MQKRKCNVYGCNTGSRDDILIREKEGRVLTFFKARRDAKVFSKWVSLIPNAGRKNFVICELHFKEEDLLRDYRTQMPDGTVHIIERNCTRLATGAIPCIGLPDLEKWGEKMTEKRKQFEVRWDNDTAKMVVRPPSPLDETCSKTVARGMCDYNVKSETNQLFLLQDEECSVTVARGMCDYKLQVYLKHKEVLNTSTSNLKLRSFEDLAHLIKTVHDYLICDGLDDPEMESKCLVFVERTYRRSYRAILCGPCKEYRRGTSKKESRRKNLIEKVLSLKREVRDSEKRSDLLERKMSLMDEHIKDLQEKLKQYETPKVKRRRKRK